MPSVLQGFEYDVFISYRHKDNRSGWVTQFVKDLRAEIEATFKEDISVYFDENRHDGLLETHDVDRSLSGKIKCLVFLPILSQTYCDPECFAWKGELIPFVSQSGKDEIGLNVSLSNGNVAKRVLPVRIHELDSADVGLFEKAIGGKMRAVDFIYSEPGVNRPLTPEDDQLRNHEKTFYRNQVNKVTNAVKQLIFCISGRQTTSSIPAETQAQSALENSIAVLPFVNMSNDPEQEFFSDGITEEVINLLVQVPGMKVTGRTSAFSFKGRNEDLRVIGDKLNVSRIVEGSVRKSGHRIRITAQLIEVSNGYHLWSEKFDRDLDDVFLVQDEIAEAIVAQLQATLTGKAAPKISREQTKNIEAYQLYLKGRFNWNQRYRGMLDKAISFFEEAIDLDPGYSLAFSGLADAFAVKGWYNYQEPMVAYPKAKSYAEQAIKNGPSLSEGYVSLAYINHHFDWDTEKAEKNYRKAIEVNPHYPIGHHWYALFLASTEKFGDAIKSISYAKEIDPCSTVIITAEGWIFYMQRDYVSSLGSLEEARQMDAALPWLDYVSGQVYEAMNEYDLSEQYYRKAFERSGDSAYFMAGYGHILGVMGKERESREVYQQLVKLKDRTFISSLDLALCGSGFLGQDEIHSLLERSLVERLSAVPYLRVDHRFQALLKDFDLEKRIRQLKSK